MKKIVLIMPFIFILAGCAKRPIVYKPDDFINPNKVIVKTEKQKLPKTKVDATFGYGNEQAVEHAYDHYIKTGRLLNVRSKGFTTLAYSAYSHPIVSCSPLHLCVIQLEKGENINNIELGDAAHWMVNTALIGSASDGSYQISIKPKVFDAATDIVISTSKRSYNIGLVSKKGAATHVVNFYYPEETFQSALSGLQQLSNTQPVGQVVDNSTLFNIDKINFGYSLSGDNVAWKPQRVFDDGDKTFIQMPPVVERMDLPVLYIKRQGKMQLVNYRYHQPYFIVDGLFSQAYLVSGKGGNMQKVIISASSRGTE